MTDPNRAYRKSPDIVFRKIADEFLLVPIRDSVADMESIFVLNEVAARVWELIDGKNAVCEIRDRITEEFDVSLSEAEKDLAGLFSQFEKIKAVL